MVNYFQISPSAEPAELPDLSDYQNYKALVIVEASVTKEWRWAVSKWLVDTGCIYMTVWFEDISLEEFFWESKNSFTRTYAGQEMPTTLLLHISKENKRESFLADYRSA